MELTPPGSTRTLPTVATQPCSSAARRAAMTRGEAQHGVVAVLEAGGAGVVGLTGMSTRQRPCGQMSLPTPTAWPRSARRAALLDVQLDERPHPGERLVVAAEVDGSGRRARIASAIVRPVAVPQAAGAVGAQRTGDDPGTGTGDTEPGALLVAEADDAERAAAAGNPARAAASTAARAPTTPSGPSKAPPSGTESRCDPMTTPGSPARGGVGVAPPGPLVAHPVGRRGRDPARRTGRRTTRAGRGPRGSTPYRRYPPRRVLPDRLHVAPHSRNAEGVPPLFGVVDMNPLHQVRQGTGATRDG